jgi:hypothetical protein
LCPNFNNYTLGPLSQERVSEASGVNSAADSFGMSFGLPYAGAIMLSMLSITFTHKAETSSVLSPAQKHRVAKALEHNAQILITTELERLLASQPKKIQDEIIRINTDASPLALHVALLIPILAGLAGLLSSLRIVRLPDTALSGSTEKMVLG